MLSPPYSSDLILVLSLDYGLYVWQLIDIRCVIYTLIIWYFWSVRGRPCFIMLDWHRADHQHGVTIQGGCLLILQNVPAHNYTHPWESTVSALIIIHFTTEIRQAVSFGMMNLCVLCVCVCVCASGTWLFWSMFMHHD